MYANYACYAFFGYAKSAYIFAVVKTSKAVRLRVLGARLWRARLNAGLSQEEVAQRLDRTQSTVSRLEHGHREIKAHEVFDLARVLGTPAEALIGPFSAEESDLARALSENIMLDHPSLPRHNDHRPR